jgi:hypothetical protein
VSDLEDHCFGRVLLDDAVGACSCDVLGRGRGVAREAPEVVILTGRARRPSVRHHIVVPRTTWWSTLEGT